ncbi:MAG: hypothetical protein MUO26_04510 [Methanotrichaceae archaeon]|nr:hypothetical protein [Methanotrichaceae archaeon]
MGEFVHFKEIVNDPGALNVLKSAPKKVTSAKGAFINASIQDAIRCEFI